MYKDLFSCNGKIAVVTGGNGLLGSRIVEALSEFGAVVYSADLSLPKIRLKTVNYIKVDFTSERSVSQVFSKITKDKGNIDILVNTAYPRTKDWGNKLENVSVRSWNKNTEAHLGGYFISSKIAAEIMSLNGGGSIVNFASIYGVVAPDFSIYEGTDMTMPAAYSAIKGGIIMFTKYLSSYYGKKGVRANVVSPGGIIAGQPRSFIQKYSKKTPLARMGKPEDVLGAVLFLSSEASSYVTGINLIVDGGWTAS